MRYFFLINLRCQLKSIKPLVYTVLLVSCFLGYIYRESGEVDFLYGDITVSKLFFGIFYFVLFIPLFYLHLTYYFQNRRLRVDIDPDLRQLSIINQTGEKSYSYKEIQYVEKNINIYKKNGGTPFPHCNYGYIRIKFDDKNSVVITSLIADITNFPIQATSTRYRFIPFIQDEISIQEKREWLEIENKETIDEFRESFQSLSVEELQFKIDHPEKYVSQAIIAAKDLLKERESESDCNKNI